MRDQGRWRTLGIRLRLHAAHGGKGGADTRDSDNKDWVASCNPRGPRENSSPSSKLLTEILRDGTQRVVGKPIEAEVADWIERRASRTNDQSRRQVARDSHDPARALVTGSQFVDGMTIKPLGESSPTRFGDISIATLAIVSNGLVPQPPCSRTGFARSTD